MAALGVVVSVSPAFAADPARPFSLAEREAIVAAVRPDEAADATVPSDAVLMARLVTHARTALGLRLTPQSVDRLWAMAPPPRDVLVEIDGARDRDDLDGWIARLEPDRAGYRALRAARGRYQAVADQGGWIRLTPSPAVLGPGDTGPAVGALRRRLAQEGHGTTPADGAAERYGADLEVAVMAFQSFHDLEPDGRLGPRTRLALEVPVSTRLAQIDANLERWRWLPRAAPPERIELNVARQDAVLYRGDAIVLSMRVIAGRPSSKTPMFISGLDAVVLNPSWHVPASIARGELEPLERRAPGTLARRGFVREGGGLRQKPGPGNALGQLKFEMPSPFGVYLHDTPSRSLFERADRLLSHGCMRLAKPKDLAVLLLGAQGWTPARLDAAIAARATRRIPLQQPVPLYVLYFTVEADEAGGVRFGADPYGWDAKLTRALASAPAPDRLRETTTEAPGLDPD